MFKSWTRKSLLAGGLLAGTTSLLFAQLGSDNAANQTLPKAESAKQAGDQAGEKAGDETEQALDQAGEPAEPKSNAPVRPEQEPAEKADDAAEDAANPFGETAEPKLDEADPNRNRAEDAAEPKLDEADPNLDRDEQPMPQAAPETKAPTPPETDDLNSDVDADAGQPMPQATPQPKTPAPSEQPRSDVDADADVEANADADAEATTPRTPNTPPTDAEVEANADAGANADVDADADADATTPRTPNTLRDRNMPPTERIREGADDIRRGAERTTEETRQETERRTEVEGRAESNLEGRIESERTEIDVQQDTTIQSSLGLEFEEAGQQLTLGTVGRDSIAARAGLRAGDQIIRIGQRNVGSPAEFRAMMQGYYGQRVPLIVMRNDQRQTIWMEVPAAAPQGQYTQQGQFAQDYRQGQPRYDRSGQLVPRGNSVPEAPFTQDSPSSQPGYAQRDAQPQAQQQQGGLGIHMVQEGQYPQIVHIYPASPAEQAGLQPGDFLLAINQQPIEHVYQAVDVITAMQPGSMATIEVDRNGQTARVNTQLTTRQLALGGEGNLQQGDSQELYSQNNTPNAPSDRQTLMRPNMDVLNRIEQMQSRIDALEQEVQILRNRLNYQSAPQGQSAPQDQPTRDTLPGNDSLEGQPMNSRGQRNVPMPPDSDPIPSQDDLQLPEETDTLPDAEPRNERELENARPF